MSLLAFCFSGFWPLAGTWLAIALAASLVMFASSYLTSMVSERLCLRMRDHVFGHMQQLSPDHFGKRRTGDLIVRLTEDLEAVEELVSSGLVDASAAAASLLLFIGAAVALQWQLTLITLASATVFWPAARGFSGRLSRATAQERTVSGSLANAIEESLANQAVVQAFNRQAEQAARLHRHGVSRLRARTAEARPGPGQRASPPGRPQRLRDRTHHNPDHPRPGHRHPRRRGHHPGRPSTHPARRWVPADQSARRQILSRRRNHGEFPPRDFGQGAAHAFERTSSSQFCRYPVQEHPVQFTQALRSELVPQEITDDVVHVHGGIRAVCARHACPGAASAW